MRGAQLAFCGNRQPPYINYIVRTKPDALFLTMIRMLNNFRLAHSYQQVSGLNRGNNVAGPVTGV